MVSVTKGASPKDNPALYKGEESPKAIEEGPSLADPERAERGTLKPDDTPPMADPIARAHDGKEPSPATRAHPHEKHGGH